MPLASLLIAFLVLFSTSLPSLAASFSASVNKKEISWNETVTLTLKINGSAYSDLNLPLETDDYRTVSQGTSNNLKIINGVVNQERTLTMNLLPKHPGTMVIPEMSVKVDGNKYAAASIQVIVRDPNESPVKGSTPRDVNQPFVLSSVSKTGPYKGEQVLLKFKLYHKGNVKVDKLPDFQMDDFLKEQTSQSREYTEVYEGIEYFVYELDYILFPVKSGTLTIPSVTADVVVVESPEYNSADPFAIFANAFMVEKPAILRTNPIILNVKALPAAPSKFSGYVGDLSVTNEIDKTTVDAGDSITLTTTLYGNGNLKIIDLNLVPKSSQYDVFKDKDLNTSEIENLVKFSQITQKAAIVPHKKGKISFNTKPIISFNPILARYETHGQNAYEIDVKRGSGTLSQSAREAKERQEKLKKEIETKKEILQISVDQVLNSSHKEIPFNSLLVLFALLNFIGLAVYLFNLFIKIGGSKALRNGSSEKIKFSEMEKKILKADSVPEISVLVKELLNRVEKTVGNHTEPELKERVEKFLHKCDQGNYGLVTVTVEELQEDSLILIKELKKHARRK